MAYSKADIALPTKIRLVKAMVFPSLGGDPSLGWRSNQSILKEIRPGISLEGMMQKLKFQYFGHLMGRVESLEKTLILGGIGGSRKGDDRG